MVSKVNRVITFYSYKGGVGRSMALANVAVLLGKWGYKTLIIDWDLEAPGIESYFADYISTESVQNKVGLIDILYLNLDQPGIKIEEIDWSRYISPISINNNSNLHLINAGKRDEDYIKKVRKFDYISFYEDAQGGQFIEELREYWLENYDFVLVDSRTGLTDSSGICSIHMPDILLLLFTPNEQSFNGIKEVSVRAIESQQSLIYDRFRLRTLPIPCRIENAETLLLDNWMKRIAWESNDMLEWLPKQEGSTEYLISPTQLLNQIKIPYKTLYAYGEKLAVTSRETSDPNELGYTYETIAAVIANDLQDTHMLIDSRDTFIKKAKGETFEDTSILLNKISKFEEQKNNLQKELEVKTATEKTYKKRNSLTIAIATGVALLVFTLFIGNTFIKSEKIERDYKLLQDSITNLKNYPASIRDSIVCKLSSYSNPEKDLKIENLKDSLRQICDKVYQAQIIFSSASVTLSNLRNEVSSKQEETGQKIDQLDQQLNIINSEIDFANNENVVDKLRKDSLILQSRKQELISKDPLFAQAAFPAEQLKRVLADKQLLYKNTFVEDDLIEGYPKITWFKEGYFLKFENIKIYLKSRGKTSINVEISDSYFSEKPVHNGTINTGESITLNSGGYNYQLVLDRIDHAGNNPLTLAAYITFYKYGNKMRNNGNIISKKMLK